MISGALFRNIPSCIASSHFANANGGDSRATVTFVLYFIFFKIVFVVLRICRLYSCGSVLQDIDGIEENCLHDVYARRNLTCRGN